MQLSSEYFSSLVIARSGNEACTMHEDASADNVRAPQKAPLGVGLTFPRFSSQDVTDECLARVIAEARNLFGEWNFQPWRWIVVRGEAAKKRLESVTRIEVPFTGAPVVLICLSDTHAWKSAPQRLQELVAGQKITEEQGREVLRRVQEYYTSSPEVARRTAFANGCMAVQQVLLSAASSGLSAYWVSEFDEAKIKTYFHIPDQFTVTALLPIGYREEVSTAPSQPGRLSIRKNSAKPTVLDEYPPDHSEIVKQGYRPRKTPSLVDGAPVIAHDVCYPPTGSGAQHFRARLSIANFTAQSNFRVARHALADPVRHRLGS
jgi:nitroreductase